MDDPIVQEVRKIREQLARKSNFDLHTIFSDVYKRQKSLGTRLVSPKELAKANHASSAAVSKDKKNTPT